MESKRVRTRILEAMQPRVGALILPLLDELAAEARAMKVWCATVCVCVCVCARVKDEDSVGSCACIVSCRAVLRPAVKIGAVHCWMSGHPEHAR